MEVATLPELMPDVADYDRRRWQHLSRCPPAKITIGARIRVAVDQWNLSLRPTKRLRILVGQLGQEAAEKYGAEPGLIERLERRLASTNDAQVREQIMKYLSEP